MDVKQGLLWAVLAVGGGLAGRAAYRAYKPTPAQYAVKLKFSNQNVDMNVRDGTVHFGFDVTNDGRKDLANVPVSVFCSVTSNEPEEQTLDTGPIAAGDTVHLTGSSRCASTTPGPACTRQRPSSSKTDTSSLSCAGPRFFVVPTLTG
jgi:hypothetical protein